ncbi:MAG: hypothetical protein LW707_07575 [Sphingobacteriales bacterium]|nr:hypothetical protein [Sphingobacteriales bacterium]
MRIFSTRNCFIALLILLGSIGADAQSDSLPRTSIVLIPYPPEYYLSDADRDICAASSLEQVQLQQIIRLALDRKLSAALETLGSCAAVCTDSSSTGRRLIGKFYDRTAYTYRSAVGRRVLSKQKARGENNRKTDKSNAARTELEFDATQALANRGDGKYMSAEPRDTTLLPDLRKTYGGDWVVSINQLDIRTNYNSCLDIVNGVYTREVMVHYSVFDPRGKEVRGDYALATFPSNDNRLGVITEGCFLHIAEEIRSNVALVLR